MQNIKNAKLIAAWGLIASLILGFILPPLALLGYLAFLYGIFVISNALDAKNIFYNLLISIGIGVVTAIVGFTLFAGSIASAVMSGEFKITSLGFSMIVTYLLMLASAFFYFKGIKELGERLNQALIKYAAYAHIIGVAMLVVFIGGFILFIALVLLIIGLFQAPDEV